VAAQVIALFGATRTLQTHSGTTTVHTTASTAYRTAGGRYRWPGVATRRLRQGPLTLILG